MKITQQQLRKIIREEVNRSLNEYGREDVLGINRPSTRGNPPPRSDSNWSAFANSLDIGVLDLDNLAADLGFDDFYDMDVSISPSALADRNPTKFISAAQNSSMMAEDMTPEQILAYANA